MIEHVKLYSGIAAKSFFKWMVVVVLGGIITFAFFLIVLFQNTQYAGGGHGNPIAFITGLFSNNWAAFVLFAGAPIFVIIYYILANKYAMGYALHQIWKNKAEAVIAERTKLLAGKLIEKNTTLNSISNGSVLRLKLLDENRKSPDASRLKKAVISYLIKRIRLDDVDFSEENLRLTDILVNKVNNFISENSKPSLRFFWILILLQLTLFIISQFL